MACGDETDMMDDGSPPQTKKTAADIFSWISGERSINLHAFDAFRFARPRPQPVGDPNLSFQKYERDADPQNRVVGFAFLAGEGWNQASFY